MAVVLTTNVATYGLTQVSNVHVFLFLKTVLKILFIVQTWSQPSGMQLGRNSHTQYL